MSWYRFPPLMVFLIFIQNLNILMARFLRVILHAHKIFKSLLPWEVQWDSKNCKGFGIFRNWVWNISVVSWNLYFMCDGARLQSQHRARGNFVSSRPARSPVSYSRSVRHSESLSQTKSRKGNTTLLFSRGFYRFAIPENVKLYN